MSLYSLEEVVKEIYIERGLTVEEVGYLFMDESESRMNPQDLVQMHMFGPPIPGWRYFEHDEVCFCWNTKPLDQKWYAPFKWMSWAEEEINGYFVRDPDSIRFCDLRREAKEEAYVRHLAAKSDA